MLNVLVRVLLWPGSRVLVLLVGACLSSNRLLAARFQVGQDEQGAQ